MLFDILFSPESLSSTIRMSVPLIFACLAGLWSERSGIVDIGLEGKMLAAAFTAAAAGAYYGSPWIALLMAIVVSVGFSLIHGYASINQRGNQVVSGVAINMLAAGLAVVLGNEWFKEGGRTPPLPLDAQFPVSEYPRHRGVLISENHLRSFGAGLSRLRVGSTERLGLGENAFRIAPACGR